MDNDKKDEKKEMVTYKDSAGNYRQAPKEPGGFFSEAMESFSNGYDKASIDAARARASKAK